MLVNTPKVIIAPLIMGSPNLYSSSSSSIIVSAFGLRKIFVTLLFVYVTFLI